MLGSFDAAQQGDRQALQLWARAAIASVGSATRLTGIREQVLDALSLLYMGEEPNKVFGWDRDARGNPGLLSDFEKLTTVYRLGQEVEQTIASDGLKPTRAILVVAVSRKQPERFVRDCWLKYVGELPV
jgi:hypothetical protein